MRIAYFSRPHRTTQTSGGNAHIGQFINLVVEQGHEIWTSLPDDREDTQTLPRGRLARFRKLRHMDVLYFRLEWQPRSQCRLGLLPMKSILGNPLFAWEFNTIPEYGKVIGKSDKDVLSSIEAFRRFGKGCDIAFCVSNAIAEYVRERLNIENTCVIPNGSDPEVFRPDVRPNPLVHTDRAEMHVVWIGSADIPWHDLDTLIQAAALIKRKNRKARIQFHLIGAGTESLGDFPSNVARYGARSYTELPSFLAPMDIGLCVYKPGPGYYSSSLKIFDYMASGLTVVGTEQAQLNELFEELDQPDLIIPHSNPEALVDVLLRLYGERDRIERQGKMGRRLVVEYYNWRRAVRDTISQLEFLLDEAAFKKSLLYHNF